MSETETIPAMNFDRKNLSNEQLRDFYRAILKPRMIEEKMLLLLRKGKISKWFAGIGQEAIAVGVTKALQQDEYILPLHRNLGVFTTRGVDLGQLFKQFQGKKNGFSKGRERSFHFGTQSHYISGMISHLGPQMGIADGVGLGYKLQNLNKVALAFTGEGGTSQGDFHEALNVAAVWELPVIFLIENNGYGLSTPVNEQYTIEHLSERAKGYGIKGETIEGNNILEVYHTINKYAKAIRKKPEPVLIECMTFRMRGHEEASGTKYVPQELFDKWGKKDPIDNYEDYMLQKKLLSQEDVEQIRNEISEEIEAGLEDAFNEQEITPDPAEELNDIYMPFEQQVVEPDWAQASEKRFVDGVAEGLREGLKKHENLIIMGQDVAEYGGVFKVTQGLSDEFGTDRIRNTTLCESAIIESGFGLTLTGMKSVIEMQFADFISSGFNAVVNVLAKGYYRWQQNADVVIRMPSGAGVGAGPFHSQSDEAWFFHTPGLKIVFPSNPADAKGLMTAAVEDPNPVLYFEHKAMYRGIKGQLPDGYYTTEIGKAHRIQEGDDVAIITYGMGVHWAQQTIQDHPEVSFDLLDLRTLQPLDWQAIEESVKRAGKVIILHEDTKTGGIGAEIAAYITENLFEYLDGPVQRSASLDTPVPFATSLEQEFLPKERFQKDLKQLIEY